MPQGSVPHRHSRVEFAEQPVQQLGFMHGLVQFPLNVTVKLSAGARHVRGSQTERRVHDDKLAASRVPR